MEIIIYGSEYGTTEKYAEALAARTAIEAKRFDQLDDINRYDTIIYLGALYAGGVMGLKRTFGKLQSCKDKKIVIATVGLADPDNEANAANIKSGMAGQLPNGVFDQASIVHLRGGIDYSRLTMKHKMMMSMLYKKAIGLPEEERTAEVRAMIETYNQKVDFVNPEDLDKIIRLL